MIATGRPSFAMKNAGARSTPEEFMFYTMRRSGDRANRGGAAIFEKKNFWVNSCLVRGLSPLACVFLE